MMSCLRLLLAFVMPVLLAASCASSAQQTREAPGPAATTETATAAEEPQPPLDKAEAAQAPAPRACDMFARPGVLHRAALVRLLDAGLARWLQGVEGDRMLANHRFQGWLIKSLHADDPCYREVDLRPGDVVQKVNGKSIEKPEQAFDVAQSLRSAPTIVVELLRDGQPRRTSIEIVDP